MLFSPPSVLHLYNSREYLYTIFLPIQCLLGMWVQMRALEMFGTFMPVLFMIGVWKCHLDTWLFTKFMTKVNTTPNGGHSFESNVPVFSLLDVKFSLDVKQNLP